MQKSAEISENSIIVKEIPAVINVYLRNMSEASQSRYAMIGWVNDNLNSQISIIEELCSGAAYCQLLEMLFPRCVSLKRVKFSTHQPHEYVDNFKLLQGAFRKLNIDKVIPVDKLVQGRFQDNFEFLQWFKKFFEANWRGRDNYDPQSARYGQNIVSGHIKKTNEKSSTPRDKKNSIGRVLNKKAPFTVSDSAR